MQKTFPNAKLAPSRQDAISYIKDVASSVVYYNIICVNSLKQCSGVSPFFSSAASADGFATLAAYAPGHQYNVMLTENGALGVDFSALQFKVKSTANEIERELQNDESFPELGYSAYDRAEEQLLAKIFNNPFESIRVWPIDSAMALTRANPFVGEPNDLFDQPIRIKKEIKPRRNIDTTDYAKISNPDVMEEPHPLSRYENTMGFPDQWN